MFKIRKDKVGSVCRGPGIGDWISCGHSVTKGDLRALADPVWETQIFVL